MKKPYTNISTHDLCWGRVSQPPNGFPLGKTTDCTMQECKELLPGENQTACFSTPQFCRTASQDLCTGRVRSKISSNCLAFLTNELPCSSCTKLSPAPTSPANFSGNSLRTGSRNPGLCAVLQLRQWEGSWQLFYFTFVNS